MREEKMMKGQMTIYAVIYVLITMLVFAALAPVQDTIYTQLQNTTSCANGTTCMSILLVVPTFVAIGILLIPIGYAIVMRAQQS